MGGLGAAWLAFIAAGTLRWERQYPKSLPRPGIYVGAAAVFSLLGVAATSEKARQPVTVFAWGLVLAQLVGGTWANALPGQNQGQLVVPIPGGVQRPADTAAANRRGTTIN